MSSFEQRGVDIQLNARTQDHAKESFERSCDICCLRGLRIDCDRCAIRVVHERLINAMNGFGVAVKPEIQIRFA